MKKSVEDAVDRLIKKGNVRLSSKLQANRLFTYLNSKNVAFSYISSHEYVFTVLDNKDIFIQKIGG